MNEQESYTLIHGDCITHMAEMEAQSISMSVFSPPFPSIFSYGDSDADIGNSENLMGDAWTHLVFFYRALCRVMKPGRVVAVHVAQIGKRKRDGEQGLYDFRGMNIRIAERAGFIYEYDWCIRKNPQSQAIRTRKWELKFQGLEVDRSISRGALPDYILKFRAPGENKVPINNKDDVSRNDWIAWAEPVWNDIRETETLNLKGTKGEGDTKHICALQLEPIRRLVKLFSMPGENVFSPFAGIGSEGVVAIKNGRRFYGVELNENYVAKARQNLDRAIVQHKEASKTLYDELEDGEADTDADANTELTGIAPPPEDNDE